MNPPQAYPLGYSEQEARRLTEQGALLSAFTEDLLRRAGIAPGMRVLDIGCGVGDVSILVAQLIGPSGSILGIDRAASSLDTAQRRAAALGLSGIRFQEADLADFEPEQEFDALVGRLVLLYLKDAPAVLRRLCRCVRSGGIVAFQEFDMSQVSQVPASELFRRVGGWILKAFEIGGARIDMGTALYTTFLRAGLPPPRLVSGAAVTGGSTGPGFEYMVDVLRSLLPLVVKGGLARPEEVGIDTLADRLREDAVANERVTFFPRVVGAWSAVER